MVQSLGEGKATQHSMVPGPSFQHWLDRLRRIGSDNLPPLLLNVTDIQDNIGSLCIAFWIEGEKEYLGGMPCPAVSTVFFQPRYKNSAVDQS